MTVLYFICIKQVAMMELRDCSRLKDPAGVLWSWLHQKKKSVPRQQRHVTNQHLWHAPGVHTPDSDWVSLSFSLSRMQVCGGERVVNRSVLKITKAQINPTGRVKQETTEKFKMRPERLWRTPPHSRWKSEMVGGQKCVAYRQLRRSRSERTGLKRI